MSRCLWYRDALRKGYSVLYAKKIACKKDSPFFCKNCLPQ